MLEDNLEIEKYGKNTISRLSSTLVPNRSVISRMPSEIISSWNGNIHLHEETETERTKRPTIRGVLCSTCTLDSFF